MSKLTMMAVAVVLALGGFGAGVYFQSTGQAAKESDGAAGPLAARSVPTMELSGAVDDDASQPPPFEFVDQDGTRRALADYEGKVLVVNFWATWCAPCLIEIPYFIAMQERLGSQGLQFLGVALDDSDKVKAFAEELGMNYPTAHGQETALDLMRAYGNKTGGLPFSAFVDRDGRIALRKAGILTEEELESMVQQLMQGEGGKKAASG